MRALKAIRLERRTSDFANVKPTMARGTRDNTLDDETWSEFRRLGIELIERLVSHIQKEEMGLLPMIETLIDDEQDAELSNNYAMMR